MSIVAFAELNFVIAELIAVFAEPFAPIAEAGVAFEGIFVSIAELTRSIAKSIATLVAESAAFAEISEPMQGRLPLWQGQSPRLKH